jgi:hypothetical protein
MKPTQDVPAMHRALVQLLLAYAKGERDGDGWETRRRSDIDLAFEMAKDALPGEYDRILDDLLSAQQRMSRLMPSDMCLWPFPGERTGWYKEFDEGYLLITQGDDPSAPPTRLDEPCLLGVYDGNSAQWITFRVPTVETFLKVWDDAEAGQTLLSRLVRLAHCLTGHEGYGTEVYAVEIAQQLNATQPVGGRMIRPSKLGTQRRKLPVSSRPRGLSDRLT